MATTCKLIARQTLSSDTATVSFSSIPATYTDLLLLVSARSSNTDGFTAPVFMRFNGSNSNYSTRDLKSQRSTAGFTVESSSNPYGVTSGILIGECVGQNLTASTFSSHEVIVPNYAGSSNKSISTTAVSENNGNSDYTFYIGSLAGLWSNTAAINEITLYAGNFGTFNFKSGSSFFLYGITKA